MGNALHVEKRIHSNFRAGYAHEADILTDKSIDVISDLLLDGVQRCRSRRGIQLNINTSAHSSGRKQVKG